jgi:hypothetical protein
MTTKLKAAKTIMLLAAIYNIFWGMQMMALHYLLTRFLLRSTTLSSLRGKRGFLFFIFFSPSLRSRGSRK